MAVQHRLRGDRRVEVGDALIHAVRQCVARSGPDVSVHDVAREAGVSVGTIYNHFESKNDLLAAAGVRSFAEFSQWARPALDKIDDPAVRLATFGRLMTRMSDTHPQHAQVIWHTQRFVWGPKYRSSEEGELERAIREGIQEGSFDDGLVEAKVTVTLGAILHFIGLRILHPSTPATKGDDVVEIVMGTLGLTPDEAHRVSHGRLPRLPMPAVT